MTTYCNGSSIHHFIYYQQQGSDVRWNLNEHPVYFHHDVGISWVSSLIHGTLRFGQNVWQMINEKYWYYSHYGFTISSSPKIQPLNYFCNTWNKTIGAWCMQNSDLRSITHFLLARLIETPVTCSTSSQFFFSKLNQLQPVLLFQSSCLRSFKMGRQGNGCNVWDEL